MKAIFLDRDGVINRYPGDKEYVTAWKDFKFLPGVKSAIARLHRNRFHIFVISNQAGVGRGLYSKKSLDLITANMQKAIALSGGKIDAAYYCTHTKEDNCPCRKPKPGLIKMASKDNPINIKNSFFIGDTIRDVKTAKRAGCKSILLLSGKEKLANRKNWETQPDFVFINLLEAADFILKR